jgi:5'(3')-deoxyribonucleotidase
MPKKKLTKKSVLVKMKRVRAALEDLLIDKTTKQQESFVPMSDTKLRDILKQVITAHVRLLRK